MFEYSSISCFRTPESNLFCLIISTVRNKYMMIPSSYLGNSPHQHHSCSDAVWGKPQVFYESFVFNKQRSMFHSQWGLRPICTANSRHSGGNYDTCFTHSEGKVPHTPFQPSPAVWGTKVEYPRAQFPGWARITTQRLAQKECFVRGDWVQAVGSQREGAGFHPHFLNARKLDHFVEA